MPFGAVGGFLLEDRRGRRAQRHFVADRRRRADDLERVQKTLGNEDIRPLRRVDDFERAIGFLDFEANLTFEHGEPRRRIRIHPPFVLRARRLLHQERHRVAVVDDRLAPARVTLVLRLDVGQARDRLHRRLVFADERLRIKEDALFLLCGDTGRQQKQQRKQNAHVRTPAGPSPAYHEP